MFTPETTIDFHPLRASQEKDAQGNVIMVRWDTDETITINETAHAIIVALDQGNSIQFVARELNVSQSEITNLLKFLIRVHFVKRIGHQILPDTGEKIRPWFPRVSFRFFSFLLSLPFLLFLCFYITAGLLIGFFGLRYQPLYTDFFWTHDVFFITIFGTGIEVLLLITHEFSHFLTSKLLGVEARIRFSNRFFNLVAVTDHYHLALLPKPQRYLIYMAGIGSDLFGIASIFWLFWLAHVFSVNIGILQPILFAVILYQFIGLLWQWNIYVETDIYNVFTDFFDQDNLYTDCKKYLYVYLKKFSSPVMKSLVVGLKKILFTPKRLQEANDMRLYTRKERHQFLFFSLFLLSGLIASGVVFVSFILPRDMYILWQSTSLWITGIQMVQPLSLLKAMTTILLVLFRYILFYEAIVRKMHRHGTFL